MTKPGVQPEGGVLGSMLGRVALVVCAIAGVWATMQSLGHGASALLVFGLTSIAVVGIMLLGFGLVVGYRRIFAGGATDE